MPQAFRHPSARLALAALVVLLLGIQPNWLPLLNDLRIARQSSSLTPQSLTAIVDAYNRQPWQPDRAESAGLAALATGQYAAAQVTLQRAAALKGWSARLHSAMGDSYQGLGDIPSAIDHWQQALAADPANAALLTKLAIAYETQEQYSQAQTALQALVAVNPDNAVAQYRLGVLLSVTNPAAAPAHLMLAAALDASVKPFAESLNQTISAGLDAKDPADLSGVVGYTLISLQEYKLAKAVLLNAVQQRPSFAEAYAYLGLAEDRLGNDGLYAYQRAIDLEGTGVQLNTPSRSLIHYLLGLHYRRLQQNQQAIAELELAFKLDKTNAAAAAELGSAYTETADLANAENWYSQAVLAAPTDASFWTLLAQFYLDHDLKVDQDGIRAAEQAATLAPDSAAAQDVLGFAEYLNGHVDLAEPALLKAQSLDPRSARIQFHLGLLYLDTNRPTQAKTALDAAVALGAGTPIATAALQAMARLGTLP
ncbi:MAG: tetratricopeptide repeat protein [Chloroflexi bacterium]|nr:tetratricopeptide repeat protein [Chloroflexota bacterium]MBI5293220.1 tetratricopeptide repeat protein [Chloroflexota bacterium]